MVTYDVPGESCLGLFILISYTNGFEDPFTKLEHNIYTYNKTIHFGWRRYEPTTKDFTTKFEYMEWLKQNKLNIDLVKCEYTFREKHTIR